MKPFLFAPASRFGDPLNIWWAIQLKLECSFPSPEVRLVRRAGLLTRLDRNPAREVIEVALRGLPISGGPRRSSR